MNITITGNLGSGKSSVCKELQKSGFDIISAGDIFREIASEKGMTVIELNEAARSDRSIDDLLDHRSMELGKKLDHTVFDSRLAWNFVEDSFKVFLLLDTQEAANRVFAGNSRGAEEYHDLEEAKRGLQERADLEQARFLELYGINYYDAGNYDLIIESSYATPKQIAQEIQRNFELYQEKPFHTKVELNVKCLYPTKRFSGMDEHTWRTYYEQEKTENHSLCALGAPDIQIQNGYNYIIHGHHHILAAIAAGKAFTQIQAMQWEDAAKSSQSPLAADDLHSFEQAGAFCYRLNPFTVPTKAGYTIDFSKTFQTKQG